MNSNDVLTMSTGDHITMATGVRPGSVQLGNLLWRRS